MDILLILLGVAALAIPLLLPVIALISGYRTRRRIIELEAVVDAQTDAIATLHARLIDLKRSTRAAAAVDGEARGGETAAAAAAPPEPAPVPARAPSPVTHQEPSGIPPAPPEPAPARQPLPSPRAPVSVPPRAVPISAPARAKPAAPGPLVASLPVPAGAGKRPQAPPPPGGAGMRPPPRPPSAPALAREPEPPSGFDWENVIGVKLFSAVAGIALVLAALFFLRYSIEHGWLQPRVRVLIGIMVGVGLIVACERKAARKYPVTANALDAAAIAILFSTFFAAHALWELISSAATFALLAVVTALAVLLSIRRDSLFIAVLGLLGGFATPALLSTGENRPIPLFGYLLLLNIGLAWIAHRKRWPILSTLTLIFTTVYQWGWVLKFLLETEPTIAMGIFLVFPVVTFAGLLLAGRTEAPDDRAGVSLERTALAAAALPLLFALYFASVPAFGARASLLFGFLMLLDVGLLAIAIARRQPLLHAAAALTTVLVMGVWLGTSYVTDALFVAIGFTAAFVVLFLAAPAVAARLGMPLEGTHRRATYAGPALLFVFAALARMEPAIGDAPIVLFAVLLTLLAACAWRAIATGQGGLYYVAAFFAIAAQAMWSTSYLTPARLGSAVTIYGVFGLVSLGVPLFARRRGTPLQPAAAGGVLLLASLGLLLFLTTGPVAPSALWALGILLAFLNAAVFVESAAGRLPAISQAGSLLSWLVLTTWWVEAAASAGLLPSLAFVAALTLLTLAGHAWVFRRVAREVRGEPPAASMFGNGLYLGLVGHLFVFAVAVNREWSLPPWPVFSVLALLTLATSAASLATRAPVLHAAGVTAAAIVITAWTTVASGMPWTLIALGASAAVAGLALAWMRVAQRHGGAATAAAAAGAVLFVAEVTAIVAAAGAEPPPVAALTAAHVVNLSIILALTYAYGWHGTAVGAATMAWLAVAQWQAGRDLQLVWRSSLGLTAALEAVFIAYPLVLGRRAAGLREPWLAAVVASAMAFFAGRSALAAGGFEAVIGLLPVVEALLLALLLRTLLRIEEPGARDLGRLAFVAGSTLAFVTVAIPLQLERQWITIGWALEGAALAWLYRRVPHRGLLFACSGLLTAVFVRLALNPGVFAYELRGPLRIINWYLYAYTVAAATMFAASWWLSRTDDSIAPGLPRAARLLQAAGTILLFILLNIEIADYYATGPEITFRFGAAVSQDLTYTIGWLVFGLVLLTAGIYLNARPARIAAVSLIAVTTFKCFLYDLGSLGGLYRVGSLVGLAISLSLVALALQKFVLVKPRKTA